MYKGLQFLEQKVLTGQNVGKVNHFLSLKEDLNLIVFGSSRANHHIDPSALSSNAFNMGMDGKGLAYFSTLIKTLPNNKTQKVIVSIDPNNLFNMTYKAKDLSALSYKYHSNSIIANEIRKSESFNPLQTFYWSIDYNSKILGIIANTIRPKYDYKQFNGYSPLTVSAMQKQIRDKTFQRDETIDCMAYEEIEINPISMNYLKSIISFCKTNNKQLIFLTTPSRLDSCDNDNRKLSDVMQKLGATYVDFTQHYDQNQNLDLWKDRTHLSKTGANEFSAFLATQL